jgi:hypothetical protein
MIALLLLIVLAVLALAAFGMACSIAAGFLMQMWRNLDYVARGRHKTNAPLPPWVDASAPELRGDPQARREIIELWRADRDKATNGHAKH